MNLGTVGTPSETQGVLHRPIAPSTANFAKTAAMSHEQLARALQAGYDSASRAHDDGCELFIGGDMGIGNSSSATALACGYGLGSPSALAGPGTGLGARGVAHKVSVLERALALHGGVASANAILATWFLGSEAGHARAHAGGGRGQRGRPRGGASRAAPPRHGPRASRGVGGVGAPVSAARGRQPPAGGRGAQARRG